MTPSDIERSIREAEDRRLAAMADRTREAFRIVNGPADGGPPGLTLDRYGRWLVLSARDAVPEVIARAWANGARVLDADGLVLKTLRRPPSATTNEVVWGTLPEGPIRVVEEGAVFLCDLAKGVPTGLFLDQRETRLRVRALARDQEVLNLFAYTCAFSVHAALGGAKRVTSVDAARAALARGRENMAASGVDPEAHRWFADDAIEHLERAARRGLQYGIVVVDPPAFGRAGKRVFSIEKDLEHLVELGVKTLAPHGTLVLAVHTAGVGELRMKKAARAALDATRRSAHSLDIVGLPALDHPVATSIEVGDDRGDYLRTLVLTIE